MLKADEITDPNSCLNKATDDEPVFVLRAHDPLADAIVERWIDACEFVGIHLDKLDDARALAESMREWREEQRIKRGWSASARAQIQQNYEKWLESVRPGRG